MKKIIKKIMLLLCLFIMTLSWNNIAFAKKTKYADYTWKEIKEAYEKDQKIIDKLSKEDIECWQKEVEAEHKIVMASPSVATQTDLLDKIAKIGNALTKRKAALNQENASTDEKNSIDDKLIKAIKDKNVNECAKILREEMDLKARQKFKKDHKSDYDAYMKLLKDKSESDEYIKQQKLMFEKEVDEVYEEMSKGDTIYNSQPEKEQNSTSSESIDDVINDGDKFIDRGKSIGLDNLPEVSNTIYNILLTTGVIIAVIVGAIIGIKLMLAGIEEKAEVKKLLVSYVIGCIIIFGGFGIWKIVVSLLQNL